MNTIDLVDLFFQLKNSYPRAAAGLLEDLCFELGRLIRQNPVDSNSVERLVSTVTSCFRPLDRAEIPDSIPWDHAYYSFGKWLTSNDSCCHKTVQAITGWNPTKMETCRTDYIRHVYANRDDWSKAADALGNTK